MTKQIAEANGNQETIKELQTKVSQRTNDMLQVYHTVAVHFADLHDTPERMLEKECINEIVPWRTSRIWMYWRLRRLLLEDFFVKEIMKAQKSLSVGQAKSMLRRWFVEDKGTTEVYNILNLFVTKLIFLHFIAIFV